MDGKSVNQGFIVSMAQNTHALLDGTVNRVGWHMLPAMDRVRQDTFVHVSPLIELNMRAGDLGCTVPKGVECLCMCALGFILWVGIVMTIKT